MSDCGTVLVVARDQETRQLVEEIVATMDFDSASAETGEAGLAAVGGQRPALAIVEVELPGINGLGVLEGLLERFGERLPVILVSGSHATAVERAAGLMLGADDYLVKPLDPTELRARIRRTLRRFESSTGRALGSSLLGADAGLSPREREILALLADGLSQREIAERLVISSRTVATHIQRVLSKFGVHSRAQALAYAYRLGLVPAAGA